eukprot:gb/GECH01009945.1/.p1 GENE.gb/GECH01009945.1/~~gb/GECH01009945.1/.p1  ORF type:complete len:207 (+),score=63.20 gb/GECH01009945.1/:1-621(+)
MAKELFLNSVREGDLDQAVNIVKETSIDIDLTNTVGETGIYISADKGHVTLTQALLEMGANPNLTQNDFVGGRSPLHTTAQNNNIKIAEILLNYGADPNIQDSQGFTPLHICSQKGDVSIAKLLISRGANTDIEDKQGKTAWYWAKENQFTEIQRSLPEKQYNWYEKIQKDEASLYMRKEDPPKKATGTKKKKSKKKKGKKKKKKK